MGLDIHYNVYGCFRDPRADVELAKYAVDAGFGGIWIGDHFLPWIDSRPYTHHTFAWFGTMMSEIPDVPVGTSVTCPMLRYRPPLLAQTIATLDNMYPGRFNLGVGVGEALNEAHFLDEWPDWDTRAEMLIEAIHLMRELWDSERYVRHAGDHFEYDHVKLYTRAKAEIPIHWAGWGPKSCYYAGKYADHLATAAGPELIPNFERGLAETDRSMDEVEVTTEMPAHVGDPDALVAEIREAGEYIPADTELDNPDPRSIQRVADNRLAEMSDREIADEYNMTENPGDVIDELERLEAAGVTRVLVGSHAGDPEETIDAFEEHILPKF
ncbi:MAG: LLM class flavin-dependent oxidoreductase [Halobacteriaceae archaeon]